MLGSCILSGRALQECKAALLPSQFWLQSHRTIYEALSALPEGGDPDLLLLENQLGASLAEVGGSENLLEIADSVPSAANVEFYVEIIKEKAKLRAYQDLGRKLSSLAQDGKASHELAALIDSQASDLLGDSDGFFEIGDIEDAPRQTGVSTGFMCLDAAIGCEGFPLGQMTVVLAREKVGKTSFMLTTAMNCANRGKKVLFASFADLTPTLIRARLKRALCGQETLADAMTWGVGPEYEAAVQRLNSKWKLKVYHAGSTHFGHDIETFLGKLTALQLKDPVDIVYLDYAGVITTRQCSESDQTATGNACSSIISRYAESSGLPIVVGSQLTEANPAQGETRPKPKYSRKWLEDGAWILSINRDDDSTKATVKILASRFGPQYVEFPFEYNKHHLTFRELQ